MPRSRSRSLESMARSATRWLSRNAPDCLQQLVDQRGLAVVDMGDDGDVAVCKTLHDCEARARRRLRAVLVLSREQSARQRKIGQKPNAMGIERRDKFALDIAHDKAVFVLGRNEGIEAAVARGPLRIDDLPGGKVRAADIAYLSLANEIVQGRKRLVDRRFAVGLVDLIEIDPIGLQAFEAGLDGRKNITSGGARPGAGIVHLHCEFGRKHDVLAPQAQYRAQLLLGAAAIAVDVGGVEKRDAEIECSVHDLARSLELKHAEIVAAEAHERDLKPRNVPDCAFPLRVLVDRIYRQGWRTRHHAVKRLLEARLDAVSMKKGAGFPAPLMRRRIAGDYRWTPTLRP
jgi:hypothetical protein